MVLLRPGVALPPNDVQAPDCVQRSTELLAVQSRHGTGSSEILIETGHYVQSNFLQLDHALLH